MRGLRVGIAALAFCLGVTPARAGVYSSLEKNQYPPPTAFKDIIAIVGALRTVAILDQLPPDAEARGTRLPREYVALATRLEEKNKTEGLTLAERVDLSAAYIRLQRFEAARGVLEASGKDRDHFLILTHLATVYYGLSVPDRAISYQEQAVKAWPRTGEGWAGWTEEQRAWYRRAERYYLELLRLRSSEERLNPGQKRWSTVDRLFPRLRPDGPNGKYEAIPASGGSLDDLPETDAYQIVAQLVLWRPQDVRLFWLLAEMMYQRGQVLDAYAAFENLRSTNELRHIDEFDRHWRVLREAADDAQKKTTQAVNVDAPPVVRPEPTRPDSPPPGPWLPEWRTALVSFAAGVVVAILAGFQWREWARRRAAA